MLGSGKGLIGLCKDDEWFPEFWTFHCIIHIMNPVLEIVNFICTHALNPRQLKNPIAELNEDFPSDLLLHCAVRFFFLLYFLLFLAFKSSDAVPH